MFSRYGDYMSIVIHECYDRCEMYECLERTNICAFLTIEVSNLISFHEEQNIIIIIIITITQ